jgi:rhodanese-related sulfurtransferase
MMPSSPYITTPTKDEKQEEEEDKMSLINRLTAAFRSQTNIKEGRTTSPPSKPRSNRNSLSNSSTTPSLRKRSSGSISLYRDSETSRRRRDSNGINYNNFVSALNEYQQQQKQPPSTIETSQPPLFNVRNESNGSPIKLKSPTLPVTSSVPSPSSIQQPCSPKTSTNNKGRVAKRLSATLGSMITNNPIHTSNSNPHHTNNNAAAATALTKVINQVESIEPADLGDLLDKEEPLLIDMRPLENYEKLRIRPSINVNLPSLLLKRYRRGVVSNFNLESFITTPEGVDTFRKWMKKFSVQDIQALPSAARLIVYDDHMDKEQDQEAVWTLIGVIAKNLQNPGHVLYIKNGFYAFQKWDFTNKYMAGSSNSNSPLPNSTLVKKSNNATLFNSVSGAPKLKMPTPMISRSATTLSSKSSAFAAAAAAAAQQTGGVNVQRRASLFSLDTTTLRANKSSRLVNHQRNNSNAAAAAAIAINNNDLSSIHERMFSPTTPATNLSSPDVFHTPMSTLPSALPQDEEELNHPLLLEDEEIEDDMVTPKTESEFDFVISEIIPHFLYLGPEIATVDQLDGLKSRSIKRILNMAEECDDDIPGLKETFQYQKIAARDTVEMQNVEGTLRKAVGVIGKSICLL